MRTVRAYTFDFCSVLEPDYQSLYQIWCEYLKYLAALARKNLALGLHFHPLFQIWCNCCIE